MTDFGKDINNIIAEYAIEPCFCIHPLLFDNIYKKRMFWINIACNENIDKIIDTMFAWKHRWFDDEYVWNNLSQNKNAIELIKRYPHKISWYDFMLNESDDAIEMMKNNVKLLDFELLCLNTNVNALKIVEMFLSNACWSKLSRNKSAIYLLRKNKNKIDPFALSKNDNGAELIIELIEEDPNVVHWLDWHSICSNERMMRVIEKYPDMIEWHSLCMNPNPNAIKMLKKVPNMIDYRILALNKNKKAIKMLKMNVVDDPSSMYLENIVMNPNHKIIPLIMKTVNFNKRPDLVFKSIHCHKIIKKLNKETINKLIKHKYDEWYLDFVKTNINIITEDAESMKEYKDELLNRLNNVN